MANISTSLIAGGAGFIGSHLCNRLLAEGHTVICIDNLITGSENNIVEAKQNSHFTFIRHDVSKDLPQLPKADYIFHLASPASPADYQTHPIETALVNSVGTMRLLDVAKSNSARFLFASTSEVYGDPKEHPQTETYWGNVNPNGVRACYDESKRFGEMMTMTYVRNSSVDGRIIRIFNTYGPRMRKNDGRVVSNFINQAINGEPLTIYGTGKQTRSFCFVDDLVEGIMKAMFVDTLAGEVINLGNPEEYSVLDLAEKIIQKTGTTSKMQFRALPQDDPEKRRPDKSKAKMLLGWEPKISVNEGLDKTIAYYKSLA